MGPRGEPGWSGTPGSVTPPIAPGDSFVVRIAPPRLHEVRVPVRLAAP